MERMETADCAVRRRGILAHSQTHNARSETLQTQTPQVSNARITPASANTAQPAKFLFIS